MKGLILSGGAGTRLRPFTYTRAKQLLPLANKPVLFYAIEALIEAGVREIGIVVGDTHAEIEAEVTRARRRGCWGDDVAITFIPQEAPLGLAHAVRIARPFLGEDRFVMFLGDNLIGQSLAPIAAAFDTPSSAHACHILLKDVADPSAFGVAELADDQESQEDREDREAPVAAGSRMWRGAEDTPRIAGTLRVRRLVEKPAIPPSNLALVGVYFFDTRILRAVESIRPSARGELEITDAIQWLIDAGYDVRAQRLDGYWIDTGKMTDILDANRQVLNDLRPCVAPSAAISESSALHGPVTVQDGAVIENSVIRGPAIIGEGAIIRDAYVGPFTSVYHDAVIEGSEVEFSIVLEHSRIVNVAGRIEESLIGRYAEVHTSPLKPRGHKLMLGDHSRVGMLA